MKKDQLSQPYKLASDMAETTKTLTITPHNVRKVSPFEAHMGRQPNTPLSDIATNSSPNNLNWESAKHACLDRKKLTKPPIQAVIMHDLQRWTEDEVSKKKQKPLPRKLQNAHSPKQQETGATSKSIELAKNTLSVRCKGIQKTIYKNTEKRRDQVARKIIRLATKVKDPKTFEQKYKTVEGKILTLTPHSAWVQTFGKKPRLLKIAEQHLIIAL